MKDDLKLTVDEIEEQKQEYGRWLGGYKWAWFATLKLTSGAPSDRNALRKFERWLTELKASEGGRDFRYVRVLEYGRVRDHPHIHAVIGGFRNRRRYWEERWGELGGEAKIELYNPEEKGLLYMLKEMDDFGDLDLDCELPPLEARRKKDGNKR